MAACDKTLPTNVLRVRIGPMDVMGIICTSSSRSFMTQCLFEKFKNNPSNINEIVEESPCEEIVACGSGRIKQTAKIVKFIARVDGQHRITLVASIIEKSIPYLILGRDFLRDTKSNFAFDQYIFNWEYNGQKISSKFITHGRKLSRIVEINLSNENKKNVDQKVSNENLVAKTNSSKTEYSKPSKRKKQSSSTAKKSDETKNSCSSHQIEYFSSENSNSELPPYSKEMPIEEHSPFHVVQKYCDQPNNNLVEYTPFNSIRNGWGKVYVATKRLSDVPDIGIDYMIGYYGVWWFEGCVSNKICGLAVEPETLAGLNYRGVEEALRQAYDYKVMRLQIFINRNEGMDLLKDYTKKKVIKKYGQGQTKGLSMRVYLLYRCVCQLIEKMSEVIFEYYQKNDEDFTREEITNLQKEVDTFIATRPVEKDDVSPQYYISNYH